MVALRSVEPLRAAVDGICESRREGTTASISARALAGIQSRTAGRKIQAKTGARSENSKAGQERNAPVGHSDVVDIDLEKLFDRVNHYVLMSRVARKIKDKRVLKLMRRYLQAAMMEGGLVSPRNEFNLSFLCSENEHLTGSVTDVSGFKPLVGT